jgi:hypothetical protein
MSKDGFIQRGQVLLPVIAEQGGVPALRETARAIVIPPSGGRKTKKIKRKNRKTTRMSVGVGKGFCFRNKAIAATT